MHKINWYGNNGRLFFEPGKVKTARCGVCSAEMTVKRNQLGPTSFVGAMAGIKQRHDYFKCPNAEKDWHKLVYNLKTYVYFSAIAEWENRITKEDFQRKKQSVANKIRAILKKHAAR